MEEDRCRMWRWCKRESRETVRSSTGDPPQTLATGSLDRLRRPVLSLGGRLWCMSALESSTLNTQQWVFPPWLFQNTGFITQGQVSSVVTRTENSFWWLICLPKAYHIISYHIISYHMPPSLSCKSLETQNAGNGENGNKRSNARTLHPVLPDYHEALLNSPERPFPPHPDCLGCCITN